MAFEISITRQFAAAHQLRLDDGRLEELHGHNWKVRVTVGAPRLDPGGVVMDFHELERRVDAVIGRLHNRHLNDLPAFARTNPSAENVAAHVAEAVVLPAGVELCSVEVWETETCRAVFRP